MKPDQFVIENAPKAKIAFLEIAPGMSPEQLDAFTQNVNAVVLIVYATGTSPESLNGVIRKRTEEGTPVFLVSKNPGDIHGILKSTYDTQEQSKNSGAISLDKVNINDIEIISAVIEDEFKKGKRNAELGRTVQEKFAYQNDEPRPVPSWEDPEQIAEQEHIYRKTLKRQSLSPEQIENTIKEWKGEQ